VVLSSSLSSIGEGQTLKETKQYYIREIEESDIEWIREILTESWDSCRVVTRGVVHNADSLPGLIAEKDEQRIGLLTYNIDRKMLEIVTLNALIQREGIGRHLVNQAVNIAADNGCSRVWVITTNDNTPALEFYQAVGFKIKAVYQGAIKKSRKLKPEIPLLGFDGIEITDEIELEKKLPI